MKFNGQTMASNSINDMVFIITKWQFQSKTQLKLQLQSSVLIIVATCKHFVFIVIFIINSALSTGQLIQSNSKGVLTSSLMLSSAPTSKSHGILYHPHFIPVNHFCTSSKDWLIGV